MRINSTSNESFNISVNHKGVGNVLKNKANIVLKTREGGNKKYVCIYCYHEKKKYRDPNKQILFCKLVDHLETKHQYEEDVKELLSIAKSKCIKDRYQIARQNLIKKIRERGIKANNLTTDNLEEFMVTRRPRKEGTTLDRYGMCMKCGQSFVKKTLHKHVSKCTNASYLHKHSVQSLSRTVGGSYHKVASKNAMTND